MNPRSRHKQLLNRQSSRGSRPLNCINLFNFKQLLPDSQLAQPGTAPWISVELLQLTLAGDLAQFLSLSKRWQFLGHTHSYPMQIVLTLQTSKVTELWQFTPDTLLHLYSSSYVHCRVPPGGMSLFTPSARSYNETPSLGATKQWG